MTLSRDHYIPLRKADLVRKLGDEPAVTIFEREQFRRLCGLLEATIHQEYHARLMRLQQAYAPFDPDDDRQPIDAGGHSPLHEGGGDGVFAQFDELLARANYRRLTREEIEAAIHTPLASGLRLKFQLDLFERLEVYVRGERELPTASGNGRVASWHRSSRAAPQSVRCYSRLAVIFQLRRRSRLTDPLDTRSIVIKLFKNIPQADVETLLPGASVTISLLERAQIVVPTLSGIGLTVFKLLKGAAAVAFAGIYGLAGFLALVSGAVGYGMRSFYSYSQTREKHQLSLTRHLYFQNLDNNAGVIYHLLAEAEDQEFREIVLAWWLLWRGGCAGATTPQLDAAAERWLRDRCGVTADFEIADALAKLDRLQIARAINSRWHAVSIEQALKRN